jgi:hypothetical protein
MRGMVRAPSATNWRRFVAAPSVRRLTTARAKVSTSGEERGQASGEHDVYCYDVTTVLLLCYYYVSTVLLLCYYYVTTVLPLPYHYLATTFPLSEPLGA